MTRGKYYYGDGDWEDRRETDIIYLTYGGEMRINYIAPEEEDEPWNNDDGPLGPQAA